MICIEKSFDVSNSFDERIQGAVFKLTEKVLEKCLEEIKGSTHLEMNDKASKGVENSNSN